MEHRLSCRLHNATGAVSSPARVTITHPNHPLNGQSLEFLDCHGARVKLRGRDGRTLQIPRDWTDFERLDHEPPESTDYLLSIDGLRELVRFFNTRELQLELKVLRASKRLKRPQKMDERVSD